MTQQKFRVGVDIGGTFTDLILVNEATGEFTVGKVLTTPTDPSEAVETVLTDALSRAGVAANELKHLVHGTTLVTNAIIERKGARTALLTTQGFRDSVEIGRENRYELYDLMLENPKPLVPRYLRFDVPQRSWRMARARVDAAHVERLAHELAETRHRSCGDLLLAQLYQPHRRTPGPGCDSARRAADARFDLVGCDPGDSRV